MSNPDSNDVQQLNDPAFLGWLKQFPQPIRPDSQDHDRYAHAYTVAEQRTGYRQARERKLLRLYRQWKAGQN